MGILIFSQNRHRLRAQKEGRKRKGAKRVVKNTSLIYLSETCRPKQHLRDIDAT